MEDAELAADTTDAVLARGVDEDGSAVAAGMGISLEDEAAMGVFMTPAADRPAKVRLADIIMGKIKEKETELASEASAAAAGGAGGGRLDERVVTLYQGVGRIMSGYRSGKVPKPFKIIPSLRNWEQVLHVTEPDAYSAAAMFQATRMFSSKLNARMAQRFYNLVLLPRIRDDIDEFKKLNFHLYMSLKKALYKPAAWYKGILLPLAAAGDCTLREAVIVSSVMARTSIPVLHSSAAMLQLAEMPYTGANSIFLRVLLDKKYALPYRVVDALAFHFYRFQHDTRRLPVLWHQCLLVFAQRYKEEMSSEQKQALLELLKRHRHPLITEDIRRELAYSRSRDREAPLEQDPAIAFAAAMEAQ